MNEQKNTDALDRMVVREDVLQICYWYQGEGFGDSFTAEAVMPFLQSDAETVRLVLEELAADGTLTRDGDGRTFRFSADGKRKAGGMFYESFTEFQQGTHGECNAGCCDGDEVCDDPGHHHHGHHHHDHG